MFINNMYVVIAVMCHVFIVLHTERWVECRALHPYWAPRINCPPFVLLSKCLRRVGVGLGGGAVVIGGIISGHTGSSQHFCKKTGHAA